LYSGYFKRCADEEACFGFLIYDSCWAFFCNLLKIASLLILNRPNNIVIPRQTNKKYKNKIIIIRACLRALLSLFKEFFSYSG